MPTTSWMVPGPQTLDLPAAPVVRVQLIGGSVEVDVWDAPGVRFEFRAVSGQPLEVRQDPTGLSIGYPFLGWEGWLKRLNSYRSKDSADLRVTLPRGTVLKIGTALADVRVRGVHEDVSVGTASGGVMVDDTRGRLDVKAVSGGLTVTGHDGAVRVNTVSGPVRVGGTLPRVEVSTVSGAVALTTTLATSVINVNSVSAAVGVTLPPACGLVLTARTISGRVLVDSVDRRTSGVTSVQEQQDATGCWLTANTVSGAVDVRRGTPGPTDDAAPQD